MSSRSMMIAGCLALWVAEGLVSAAAAQQTLNAPPAALQVVAPGPANTTVSASMPLESPVMAAPAPLQVTQPLVPASAPKRSDLISRILSDMGDVAMFPFTFRSDEALYFIPSAGAIELTSVDDVSIYQNMHDPRNALYDQIMPVWTDLGDGVTDMALCAVLYGLGGEKGAQTADLSLETLADTGLTVFFMKAAFGATRPNQVADQHNFFDYNDAKLDGGFPSGHTAVAFAMATVMGRSYHLEIPAYLLAAGVGYSRIYLSAHWPSDVLAGAVLGTWMGFYVLDKRGNPGEAGLGLAPGIHNGAASLDWKARW